MMELSLVSDIKNMLKYVLESFVVERNHYDRLRCVNYENSP